LNFYNAKIKVKRLLNLVEQRFQNKLKTKVVKIFKERCAELGEPNKSLLLQNLLNPRFQVA
jgi:hypothetical protein